MIIGKVRTLSSWLLILAGWLQVTEIIINDVWCLYNQFCAERHIIALLYKLEVANYLVACKLFVQLN